MDCFSCQYCYGIDHVVTHACQNLLTQYCSQLGKETFFLFLLFHSLYMYLKFSFFIPSVFYFDYNLLNDVMFNNKLGFWSE
jgi:hypothetical protein